MLLEKLGYTAEGYGYGTSPLTDKFHPDAWRFCTSGSLRGHIINAHFKAMTLSSIGVAAYDIEIASVRQMDLTKVVEAAYERLDRTDHEIQNEINDQHEDKIHKSLKDFTVDNYRTVLVKNLKYIEQLGLAEVDWGMVERSVPNARSVELDLETDTTDASFLNNPNIKMPPEPDKKLELKFKSYYQ